MRLSTLLSRRADAPRLEKSGLPQVTAVLSVYREHHCLDRCFANMAENGVTAVVIDNDADGPTRAIIEHWRGAVVREVRHHPNPGFFDWTGLLRHKQEIVNTWPSDWFILWDSDEIREPPEGYPDLRHAFAAAEESGANAVGFDEFVFVPTDDAEDFAGRDYVAEMEWYYFFQPRKHQRLNAFRRQTRALDLMRGAGHEVHFPGRRVWAEACALRHYLFLSRAHGVEKYCGRIIGAEDLARGWMRERAATTPENFRLPDRSRMKRKLPGQPWDRSSPLSRHPSFFYAEGEARP